VTADRRGAGCDRTRPRLPPEAAPQPSQDPPKRLQPGRSATPKFTLKRVGRPAERRLGVLIGALAAINATAAGAFACTNLATLHVSSMRGRPGEVVTATGSIPAGAQPDAEPITLRWDGPQGITVATALPEADGHYSASFHTPPGENFGFHVIVATKGSGRNLGSGPVRVPYQVVADDDPSLRGGSKLSADNTGPRGSGWVGALLTVGMGTMGLGLLGAAGCAGLAGRSRRPVAWVPAPVGLRRPGRATRFAGQEAVGPEGSRPPRSPVRLLGAG